MVPPRRKVVIFKAGGYIFSDLEALIQDNGLGHVMRVTNLIRKVRCCCCCSCHCCCLV